METRFYETLLKREEIFRMIFRQFITHLVLEYLFMVIFMRTVTNSIFKFIFHDKEDKENICSIYEKVLTKMVFEN